MDRVDAEIQQPPQIDRWREGEVAVYREQGDLVVRGYITSIGDPSCADARVSQVELNDGTLSVVVRNNQNGFLLCAESAGAINYRVAIAPGNDPIRRVRVRHYADDGEVTLSGVVGAPEMRHGY